MKRIFISCVFCAVALAGCVKENVLPKEDEANYIQLQIGEPTEIQTRAASINELDITNAYILVFSGGYYKTGEKVDLARDMSGKGSIAPKIKTGLSISEGDVVIVLCNAGSDVSAPFLEAGDTEAKINDKFIFPALTVYNPADLAGVGKNLPMSGRMAWGIDTKCIIYRSVAKIQLALDIPAGGDVTGRFSSDVPWDLYNINTNGCIYSENGLLKVPAGSAPYSDMSFTKYPIGSSGKLTAAYLPECHNSTVKGNVSKNVFSAARTCMIVRTGSASSEYRYYRIDLYDKNSGEYLDIRRNTHYIVTITKVRSEGYNSIEQALAHPASNVEYDITVSDSSSSIVLSNGQYALQVSNDEVYIFDDRTAEHEIIKVGYTLPGGVVLNNNILNSIRGTGLTLSAANQKVTNSMTGISARFNSGVTAGTITVQLGNLSQTVNVYIADQLSLSEGSKTQNYRSSANLLSISFISYLENDNKLKITDNGSSFTLSYPANEKTAVRRFDVNIHREYADGKASLVRIVGKQQAAVLQN